MMTWRVPLSDVNIGLEEEAAVLGVLRSGWLSMGSVTQAFEADFAEFVGAGHALAVTNATAALHLACLAAGIGPGDEVILPSLTFVATANAVRYTGADTVFADIESLDWLTLDPEAVEAAITPRTKAIMVMHYAGFACDMPAIMAIAAEYGLVVLEDAAHAVGASLEGRDLGTWGDVGCYSFFANKNMTTAEGGMIVTDDDELAEKLHILRSHGMTTLTWDRHQGHASTYDVVDLGYNYRIDELRSAIGREQLRRIPAANARRGELVALYREQLGEAAPAVQVPFSEGRGQSSYHIMSVLLPDGVDKAGFRAAMKDQGIQTSWHYPPIHHFSIYEQGWREQDNALPLTEAAADRLVTLPLYPTMTDQQLGWVVEAVARSL